MKSGSLRPRNLRRRMSVKGAIKKTRSINVDCKYTVNLTCFLFWWCFIPFHSLSFFYLEYFFVFIYFENVAETLGMEGNITERRISVAVTPLWLDSSNTLATPTTPAAPQDLREISPCPELAEEGLPPNKVQIQTPEVPRIQVPARHPKTENFENTEVEELIAMLRETENLEEQGDILQYLVDTQGLDFNTGEYSYKKYQKKCHDMH